MEELAAILSTIALVYLLLGICLAFTMAETWKEVFECIFIAPFLFIFK